MGDLHSDDLPRRLGLWDAVAIYVGIIIGSGVFVAPAAVAAVAPGYSGVWLWVLGGVISACGALCYAECGARLPYTGGFYVYLRAAYGEPVAFVGAWAGVLVTYPASIAAIALILSGYLGEILPATAAHPSLTGAAVILGIGLLNAVGARTGARVQNALTAVKVLALLGLCAAALAGRADVAASQAVPVGPPGASSLLVAMVALLWTYDGWSDISLVTGELRDPGRNLGRAVVYGSAILVAVYSVVQVSVVSLLGAAAGSSQKPLADAATAALGPTAATVLAVLVVISTFGSLHGIVLTCSRLGFAMAKSGTFPRWFAAIHPVWQTPTRAVGCLVAASIFYVLAGSFRDIIEFFAFSIWIFYGLIAVALLILRKRGVGDPGGWRAPGGVLPPLVVLVTGASMTTSLVAEAPWRAGVGVLLFGAGFAAHWLWQRRKPSTLRS